MIEPTQQKINTSIEEYKSKPSNIQLPDIDMAMHPSKVYFADDISDTELFNDRFIESRVHEGMGAFAIYLMVGIHNFTFIFLFYLVFLSGTYNGPFFFICINCFLPNRLSTSLFWQ